MSDPPAWTACNLDVRHAVEHTPQVGIMLRFTRGARPVGAVLGPELTRSLAHWLLWAVGDSPAPADPDAVRAAVDEQRRLLMERHRAPGLTAEADTELAWAFTALDAIAAAASRPPP